MAGRYEEMMISFFDVKRSGLYVGINIKKGGKDGKDTLDTYLNLKPVIYWEYSACASHQKKIFSK